MKVYLGKFPKCPHSGKERKIEIRIDSWDCWNLDYTLALIIAPALKKLKELQHGFPCEFSEIDIREDGVNYGGNGGGVEAWNVILDKMINAFEEIINDEDADNSSYLYNEEKRAMVQEGLDLFAKYYFALWD
jgi:hypothetical protein